MMNVTTKPLTPLKQQDSLKPVAILIPSKFRWQCRQPTGEWYFSVERPYLDTNGDYLDEESPNPTQLIEWWKADGETLEFQMYCTDEVKDWKNSLTRI